MQMFLLSFLSLLLYVIVYFVSSSKDNLRHDNNNNNKDKKDRISTAFTGPATTVNLAFKPSVNYPKVNVYII